MKPDYSYQTILVDKAVKELSRSGKVVLAAAPGAGKTQMALQTIERLRKKNKNLKTLIFTHGQILLRDQWANVLAGQTDFERRGIVTSASKAGDLFKEKNVLLSIPQTLVNANVGEVDLLIVDEAHQRYLQGQIQSLLETLNPKHQLLLTGTPSVFLANPDEWRTVGITVEELLAHGVAVDPTIEIVQTDYEYRLGNYDSNSMQLRPGDTLSTEKTKSSLDHIFPQLIRKLASDQDPAAFDWSKKPPKDWAAMCQDLRKTMVVCNNQRQALDVAHYFKEHGVRSAVSIWSTGSGTQEMNAFMNDKDIPLFIVVNRGTLGFNYEELFNIIDLGGSLNINRLFQQICRVIRPSKENPKQKKIYIKATNRELAELTYFIMSFTVALAMPEYYYTYTSNYETRKIPVDIVFYQRLGDYVRLKQSAGPKDFPDLPRLLTFKDLIRHKKENLASIGYTDFRTVLGMLKGNMREQWTLEKAFALAKECSSRTQFMTEHRSAYWYLARMGKLDILAAIFGERMLWDEEKVRDAARKYQSLTEFRAAQPSAYNWLKHRGLTHLAQDWFKPYHAVTPNDVLLKELVADPAFQVTPTGEAFYQGRACRFKIEKGSKRIYFTYQGIRTGFSLARTLWLKFKGPIPKGMVVSKIDPKGPTHLDNLQVLTVAEKNRRHGENVRKGLSNVSRDRLRGNAKINMAIARSIRKDHKNGMTYRLLCQKYEQPKSQISYIINNKTWVEEA